MTLDELVSAIATPVETEEAEIGSLGALQVQLRWDAFRTSKFLQAGFVLSQNPCVPENPQLQTIRLHALTVLVAILDPKVLEMASGSELVTAADKLKDGVDRITLMNLANKIDERSKLFATTAKATEKN